MTAKEYLKRYFKTPEFSYRKYSSMEKKERLLKWKKKEA